MKGTSCFGTDPYFQEISHLLLVPGRPGEQPIYCIHPSHVALSPPVFAMLLLSQRFLLVAAIPLLALAHSPDLDKRLLDPVCVQIAQALSVNDVKGPGNTI